MKKIVVIGPESTGKSTLCELLAKQYNTVWCPEYAREYLTERGSQYTYEDLLIIAKGQVALEEAIVNRQTSIVNDGSVQCPWPIVHGEEQGEPLATERHQITICDIQSQTINRECSFNRAKLETGNRKLETIFIDTDLYVMKVWCEFVFNKCHTYILEQIAERKYDLYLLCNVDLPWAEDPLREYPDEKSRRELYRIYKEILLNQHTPWVEISGGYEERLQTAVAAIDKLLDA